MSIDLIISMIGIMDYFPKKTKRRVMTGGTMSDRTWNRLYMSIYEERWTFNAKEIAIYLIANCTNQYGVYKFPWWSIEKHFAPIMDVGQIQDAIEELRKENFLKTYDNDDIVFLLTKWQKDCDNPNIRHRIGAYKFIQKRYPEILDDYVGQYPELDTHSIPIVYPMHITDTDTEADTESESDKRAAAVAASRKSKSKNRELTKEPKPTAKTRIISDAYQESYLERYGRKPIWNSATGARTRQILKDYDGDAKRIAAAIRQAFKSHDTLIIKNLKSFMSVTGPSILARADTEALEAAQAAKKGSITDPDKYGKSGKRKL